MTAYKTTTITKYYMKSGNLGGTKPAGFPFESTSTAEINGITCRNVLNTNEYIPAIACVEVGPSTPPPDGEQVFDVTLRDSVTGKTYSGTLREDVG